MKQPTKADISNRIEAVLSNRMFREELGDWANDLIMHYDDVMNIEDWEAWEYLKEVGCVLMSKKLMRLICIATKS